MVIESLFEALLNFLYLVFDTTPVISLGEYMNSLTSGITQASEFLGDINYFIPLNVIYILFRVEIIIFSIKIGLAVFGFIKKYIPLA